MARLLITLMLLHLLPRTSHPKASYLTHASRAPVPVD
jgi:hypothetical protein